jgi:hypothetical protein
MIEKQQKFLDALFGEAKGDHRKAMDIAGYSASTSVREVVKPLAKEIEERTRDFIAFSGPKAVATMFGILSGEETLGIKEKIAASKDFLDRAGFGKVDKIEIESKSPLFILPPKSKSDESD